MLELWPVTHKSNMGEAHSALVVRNPLGRLHFQLPLFAEEDVALPLPLEQANGRLVQVDLQKHLTLWSLLGAIIEPRPCCEGLV